MDQEDAFDTNARQLIKQDESSSAARRKFLPR
jgi:hypothetical protein